jgi:hypothetical protein
VTTLTQRPAGSWTPCTYQGHLDDVRELHEDIADRVLCLPHGMAVVGFYQLDDYVKAIGVLLDHLDGKHAADCLVELRAETA